LPVFDRRFACTEFANEGSNDMAELNARDAKLVQFLNEAHAKEAELEADLTAHISLTQKAPYKKRLQQHLKETRDHKRRVSQRIKQLGGQATSGVRAPGVPDAVGELAGKGIAAVKGQVGVARAAITEQAETHLRNAREELREEYVEIGTYTLIEALANEVGDKDTARLARDIKRDEQKTADYLEKLIPQLIKDLVKNEIPRDQRASTSRRRSTRARSSSTRTRGSSSSSSRSSSSSSSRSRGSTSSAKRSSTSATKTARKTARKAASGARRATKAAATGARSGAKAASTSAKRSSAGSKGGSSNGRSSSRSGSRKSTSRKSASRS
jgi:ferritin-like metal-binding protein YciE